MNETKFDIQLFNRQSGRMETEEVYGRRFMDLFYGTVWGRAVTSRLLCRSMVSKLYAMVQNHPWSRRQIDPFIRTYHIDLNQVVIPPGGFPNFNAFFIRRLKSGIRVVDPRGDRLISPADSRLQIFSIANHLSLTVKGMSLSLPQLLGVKRLDARFENGLCLCFRLAPCDYHRFGYVDDGVQGPVHSIHGPLHSVSPLAMRHKPDILGTNLRQWCFLQSPGLGTMIVVEVGAMMVGSIVQRQPRGGTCRRGEEKGYFQFGGSTVLLILEPGKVVMDKDIQDCSAAGIETLVQYGEAIGRKVDADETSPEFNSR